jgi:hypothetical protein
MKTVTLTSSQNVSRSLADASLVIEGEEFAGNIVHYAGSQVIFESGRFEEICLEHRWSRSMSSRNGCATRKRIRKLARKRKRPLPLLSRRLHCFDG